MGCSEVFCSHNPLILCGFLHVFFLFRAQLVPVFSFGENELFDQMENPSGSPLRRLQVGHPLNCLRCIVCKVTVPNYIVAHHQQNRLQSIMGVALPLFHARGVFQYSFGLIPYRKPIYTVGTVDTVLTCELGTSASFELTAPVLSHSPFSVGKPIAVVQTPSPSSEDIDSLHRVYLQSLTELFEEHKHNYGLRPEEHLTFI